MVQNKPLIDQRRGIYTEDSSKIKTIGNLRCIVKRIIYPPRSRKKRLNFGFMTSKKPVCDTKPRCNKQADKCFLYWYFPEKKTNNYLEVQATDLINCKK